MSPKENREIPPLRYDVAERVKQDFPQLEVHLNGGIKSLDDVLDQLTVFDGVMIGREAYANPFLFADIDHRVFGDSASAPTRFDVVERYRPFLEKELAAGTPLKRMTRHVLGLFNGVPGARQWRRILSVEGVKQGAGMEVVEAALDAVRNPASQAA